MDMSSKHNGIEITNGEKEADLKNNSVKCRLLNEENVSEERKQSSCDLKKNKTQPEERASILRKIARNLDLDLLRDKRYLAIVLGKLLVIESTAIKVEFINTFGWGNRNGHLASGRDELQRDDTLRPG